MKKIFILLSLLVIPLSNNFAQREFVRSDNPVYEFLERMYEQKIIIDYNAFEIPKTRNEIADYLRTIYNQKYSLNKQDRGIVEDLAIEFEFDINGSLYNSLKMIKGDRYNLLSDKEKYLFYDSDKSGNAIFINLLAEGKYNSDKLNSSNPAFSVSGNVGGELRGTLLNKFGFSLRGTNGYAWGSKNVALLTNELNYNFKFNEKPEERFFDNTEGYLTADFDFIRFKIGRDRIRLGHGEINSLIEDSSPPFDYLGMNISYSIINFSWFHGKLQGYKNYIGDSITGGSAFVPEKYLGYHRLAFKLSDYFQLGIGEFIIYGERPLEFAYLNPFNFYKSAEHSGTDRDNSMLFMDVSSVPVKGIKLYASILLDDINYGKIGKGWYGNQTFFTTGLSSTVFYSFFPVHINAEYQRIEPYVFTHRLLRNNFTNLGLPLNNSSLPNSENFALVFSHYFYKNLLFSINYRFTIHGANPIMNNGSVINVGGDINLGHRIQDSETIHFLDGFKEYMRNIGSVIRYEPFNNIILYFQLNYINNSMQTVHDKDLQSFLNLSVKF